MNLIDEKRVMGLQSSKRMKREKVNTKLIIGIQSRHKTQMLNINLILLRLERRLQRLYRYMPIYMPTTLFRTSLTTKGYMTTYADFHFFH